MRNDYLYSFITKPKPVISKSSGYAIRGVIYLVSMGYEDRRIGIHEIAKDLDIPQHFMAKILQDLVKRKILGSAKGPNGGFFATAETPNLSLMDIIDIVDGKAAYDSCLLGLHECSREKPCPLHFEIIPFRDNMIATLRLKLVGDLAKDVEAGKRFLSTLIT